MITDHLKPGHLTYMQVEAEAPGALAAFITWVTAYRAHQLGIEMVERARDAADVIPRDDGLIMVWREAAHTTSRLAVGSAEAMRFLATMLHRAEVDLPDAWAQAKLRALELEAGEAEQQVA